MPKASRKSLARRASCSRQHTIDHVQWSPRRIRIVRAAISLETASPSPPRSISLVVLLPWPLAKVASDVATSWPCAPQNAPSHAITSTQAPSLKADHTEPSTCDAYSS